MIRRLSRPYRQTVCPQLMTVKQAIYSSLRADFGLLTATALADEPTLRDGMIKALAAA